MYLKAAFIKMLSRWIEILSGTNNITSVSAKNGNIVSCSAGKITINNQVFKGKSVSIIDNEIFIDGVRQSQSKQPTPVINITIERDCESVNLQSGDVVVKGKCHTIKTASGNVQAYQVGGDITTVSGNISCHDVCGNAKTVSGNIIKK